LPIDDRFFVAAAVAVTTDGLLWRPCVSSAPLPPVVMATVYSRIYGIARRQAREIHKLEASLGVFDATPPPPGTAGRFSDPSPVDARRSAAGNSKEPKAIKTLGILMGMLDGSYCVVSLCR